MRKQSVSTLVALLVATGAFSTVTAKAARQGVDLEACVAIQDDSERLACFDSAMADRRDTANENESTETPLISAKGDAPAPPSRDFVVLPRAEAEELRRRAAADSRTVKRISYESKIVRIFTTGYNTRNVELENGEIWRELRGAVGTKPHSGEVARIAPASFGSWTIQYGERSSKFKVRRTK